MLVFDVSGSIRADHWTLYQTAAQALIAELPIAPTKMRVGLVEFAEEVRLASALSDSKEALNHAVLSFKQDLGRLGFVLLSVATSAA